MAFIYNQCRTSPLTLQCAHDPDAKIYYSFRYRAPAWSSSTEKREITGLDEIADIVRPGTANGFYYECYSAGITGTTEPTWPTTKDGTIIDGTVTWKAVPDDTLIRDGDAITSSSWECDTVGVVMDNDSYTGFDTSVRITAVPSDATSFILRNVITITRSGGNVEDYNRSIKIKIKDQ